MKYRDEAINSPELVKAFGCTQPTIMAVLKANGIKPRRQAESLPRLYGEDNPAYRGGHVDYRGYRVICVKGIKYFEHRWVMEQHLKRKLKRTEIVHHINHNKLDNRVGNLILTNMSDHARIHGNLTRR